MELEAKYHSSGSALKPSLSSCTLRKSSATGVYRSLVTEATCECNCKICRFSVRRLGKWVSWGEECEAAHRDAATVLAVAAVRMQRNPS